MFIFADVYSNVPFCFLTRACHIHVFHAACESTKSVPSNVRVSVVDVCANSTCVLCAQVCGICALTNPAFHEASHLGWRNKDLAEKRYKKARP
jgi:hypothetical protein